ncbi:hypothetical protein RvY_11514 [Ramazzottius varieornatus]|uniref:Uncharacterized protein n=1 Tax=Ramazzottius varieornatus TaxID=947166 RepID=A0A1D1VP51_RAMVA|nr:hypothetical protein RvY_11514 [Ramazzottius varieornatus]
MLVALVLSSRPPNQDCGLPPFCNVELKAGISSGTGENGARSTRRFIYLPSLAKKYAPPAYTSLPPFPPEWKGAFRTLSTGLLEEVLLYLLINCWDGEANRRYGRSTTQPAVI